ncbi:hypothetical protein CDAR_286991 [Caerostris darwini]|uniref:Uncharacterized protein n=1 Tax=Caerostris darwini TaxID=1538125 RepID=A0AAV4RAX9_9ARAC|nr:hypothetical protein CDAR_286991 [Caerostris darwini]
MSLILLSRNSVGILLMLCAPRRCSKVGPTRPRDKQFRSRNSLSTLSRGWEVGEGGGRPFNLRAVRSGRRPQLRVSSKSFRFAVIKVSRQQLTAWKLLRFARGKGKEGVSLRPLANAVNKEGHHRRLAFSGALKTFYNIRKALKIRKIPFERFSNKTPPLPKKGDSPFPNDLNKWHKLFIRKVYSVIFEEGDCCLAKGKRHFPPSASESSSFIFAVLLCCRATDGIIMAEGFDRVISTNRDERTTDAIETLFYRLSDRFGSRGGVVQVNSCNSFVNVELLGRSSFQLLRFWFYNYSF